MARKPAYKPQRKDWTEIDRVELVDGSTVVKWHNVMTSEESTLREGVHPMDNPNSIALTGIGNGHKPCLRMTISQRPNMTNIATVGKALRQH